MNLQKVKVQSDKSQNNSSMNFFLLAVLFIYIGMIFSQKIILVTADLGRHIKNGEMILSGEWHVLYTNFYSYTEPGQPSIMHHWGAGVIFYLIHKLAGFDGLSIFYVLISLTGIYCFFTITKNKTDFRYALFFTLLSVPFITDRIEIRPEGFSFLFLGVYLCLLYKYKENKIQFNKLACIISVLQALWINIHIFFIMGLFLIFLFLLDSMIFENNTKKVLNYTILLLVSIAVCLFNPFGITGLLVPFTIFREYGYMIVENQSVLFMQNRFHEMKYVYFEVMFAVVVLSFILAFIKTRMRDYFIPLICMSVFTLLAWKAIRGIPVFGLFFILSVSENMYNFTKTFPAVIQKNINRLLLACSILILFTGYFIDIQLFSPYKKGSMGVGLINGISRSAEFVKQNRINGPIFNNYDIGGYLIFNLFPEYKLFVDNRPESYSQNFFKKIYEPMQEKEDAWKQVNDKYKFNMIYFYRLDITPWAQPFLINRIKDPQWAPVFVDYATIILVHRTKQNDDIIKQYELPKSMFSITK